MPKENETADSPQLAHYRHREKELTDKLKRIAEHPPTKDHDLLGAKSRTETALKQVRAEIAKLEKK